MCIRDRSFAARVLVEEACRHLLARAGFSGDVEAFTRARCALYIRPDALQPRPGHDSFTLLDGGSLKWADVVHQGHEGVAYPQDAGGVAAHLAGDRHSVDCRAIAATQIADDPFPALAGDLG